MKRIALALVALAFSASVLAVDVTVTLTAGEITKLRAALGDARNLRNPDTTVTVNGVVQTVSGTPRVATAQEVKDYVSDVLRALALQYDEKVETARVTALKVAPTPINPQ